ncbi:MAG: glycoside hydrolase family 92 protein, partial [Bacteroidetes bacterium]|nr:glycoside hydrolase family 92 protein [Bacteroidota bacterium]
QTERNSDMVGSMLAHFDQSVHPMLPVWSHYSNENGCMIGYHSVSVIADAIEKGTYKGDLNRALDACVRTANYKPFDGIQYYLDLGYVPEDKNGSSASKTLEYAYDDWCIAQIAKKAGNMETYDQFMKRSENYINVFDPEIGYMRPKLLDGTFRQDFDPLNTHGQGFIEGNDSGNGKTLAIKIENQSSVNFQVRSVTLNREKIDRPFITYKDLICGGLFTIGLEK